MADIGALAPRPLGQETSPQPGSSHLDMMKASPYVLTDGPEAVLYGNVQWLELSSHALEWCFPLSVWRAADGAWDEPPRFPGLSNAY